MYTDIYKMNLDERPKAMSHWNRPYQPSVKEYCKKALQSSVFGHKVSSSTSQNLNQMLCVLDEYGMKAQQHQ